MAAPKINGTLQPVLQPLEITYDPSRGSLVKLTWESAGNNLGGIATNLLNNRIAYQFQPNGRKSRIVATATGSQAGYPDIVTDTWQILANEIQKDIKQHPLFLAMEAAMPGTIGYVVRDVALYNQGLALGTPAPDPSVAVVATQLFNLLIRGTTHYALSQYVLRHTTNVSNAYAANVSDLNINCVYNPAALFAEVTNANSWIFPLPGRLLFKLQAIAAPIAQPFYLWGWRKLAATETTAATNRIDITTEYWLEQWSTVLYNTVIL